MAGDLDWAGAVGAALGVGEAVALGLKSTTSPSAFLMTMALLCFFGRSKAAELGAGLADVTLGVCEIWLTLVIAGVVG